MCMVMDEKNNSHDDSFSTRKPTRRQFPQRSRKRVSTASDAESPQLNIDNNESSSAARTQLSIPTRPRYRSSGRADTASQTNVNADKERPPTRRVLSRQGRIRHHSVTRTGIRIPLKWVVLGVLTLIGFLVLAFIVSRTSEEPHPTGQAHTATSEVKQIPLEVSGRLGAPVRINLTGVLTVRDAGTYTLLHGDGRAITAGDRVYVKVSTFDAATGKFSGSEAVTRIGPATPELLPKDLYEAIIGVHEGTRLVLVRNVVATESTRLEVSVVDILPTVATGKQVSAPADAQAWVAVKEGIPQVIDVKSAQAAKPWGHTVIKGAGDQIPEGSTIIAQFLMIDANTKALTESTWDAGGMPMQIDLKKAMQPLATELVDQPVGSRVIVTIPAAQANGNNPVVVVVDVLGIAQEENK